MSNDELVWLTYAEAAERMRIKPDSVRRRAAARKWARRIGNDGKASVGIPPDILPALTNAATPDNPDQNPTPSVELAAAKTEIRLLREQLDDLKEDRDAWREQAAKLSEPRPGIIDRILGRAK